MIVHIDQASSVPVFEQLRSQITRLIVSGQLKPGATLPSIRSLASDLGLARGTVNKVYEHLARDGLVEMAGRRGTIVLSDITASASVSDLEAAADTLAVVTRQIGKGPEEAHAALDAAFSKFV